MFTKNFLLTSNPFKTTSFQPSKLIFSFKKEPHPVWFWECVLKRAILVSMLINGRIPNFIQWTLTKKKIIPSDRAGKISKIFHRTSSLHSKPSPFLVLEKSHYFSLSFISQVHTPHVCDDSFCGSPHQSRSGSTVSGRSPGHTRRWDTFGRFFFALIRCWRPSCGIPPSTTRAVSCVRTWSAGQRKLRWMFSGGKVGLKFSFFFFFFKWLIPELNSIRWLKKWCWVSLRYILNFLNKVFISPIPPIVQTVKLRSFSIKKHTEKPSQSEENFHDSPRSF